MVIVIISVTFKYYIWFKILYFVILHYHIIILLLSIYLNRQWTPLRKYWLVKFYFLCQSLLFYFIYYFFLGYNLSGLFFTDTHDFLWLSHLYVITVFIFSWQINGLDKILSYLSQITMHMPDMIEYIFPMVSFMDIFRFRYLV